MIINASLEQAWRSWTTREGIVAFFAPAAHIEARVGGAFQIYMAQLQRRRKPAKAGAPASAASR